jgi:leucine dehydrogenase
MAVFSAASFSDHEEVVFCNDPESGLKAIIAIHDTTLGPALGGCRMWPYASEAEALEDVLRLARGMTYKAAMAELDFGGGKSVVIGDPRRDKTAALLTSLGRFVDSLGGRYIVAEDVGTSVPDMEIVRQVTEHVAGTARGGSGDPSPATAWGVYQGIRAALEQRFGRADLEGVAVAVQGLGHVGGYLCEHLAEAGARLIVSDIDGEAVRRAEERYGAAAVGTDEIYDAEAEVFAPCALGAILDDGTIPRLKVAIVAGAANNQLAETRHGAALAKRGILYAPDYVINAGGIINISHEAPRYDREAAFDHVAGIHDTLAELFARAEAERLPTSVMADCLAAERIENHRHEDRKVSGGHQVAVAALG